MIHPGSIGFLRSRIVLATFMLATGLMAGAFKEARSQVSELALPPLPAGIEQPAEYAFGDAVMQRDQRAWGRVFDALALRFGKARLRVLHLTSPADADVAAVRRGFDREMVDRRKWRPVVQDIRPQAAWAYGYESPDGRHVLMLVGLKPRAGETLVPLSIVTTLGVRS